MSGGFTSQFLSELGPVQGEPQGAGWFPRFPGSNAGGAVDVRFSAMGASLEPLQSQGSVRPRLAQRLGMTEEVQGLNTGKGVFPWSLGL